MPTTLPQGAGCSATTETDNTRMKRERHDHHRREVRPLAGSRRRRDRQACRVPLPVRSGARGIRCVADERREHVVWLRADNGGPARNAARRGPSDHSAARSEALATWRPDMSKTNDDIRRRRVIRAAATGEICAGCGRRLAATAPVWRGKTTISLGPFRYRWVIAPFCERCTRETGYRQAPEPCEGCGRMVNEIDDRRMRRHTFCCAACKPRQQQALVRQRRAEVRGASRSCGCCGEPFEPARADAVFCSGVCRQKAYRRRVTDIKDHCA